MNEDLQKLHLEAGLKVGKDKTCGNKIDYESEDTAAIVFTTLMLLGFVLKTNLHTECRYVGKTIISFDGSLETRCVQFSVWVAETAKIYKYLQKNILTTAKITECSVYINH
ncbi:hypothetical protein [Chamaesiphon minutus]|uniref:Uncharacterized protein n=1 Tax=Chamaesiphon minutus (strain ATCC 27169 / PCC 6605) TaxID=1173020 RepID=K9UJ17_CHAP6|nr:hypothetical protein [Chamaesiphon minutus]AFY94199.1 hypothetical protein Cha6605_3187 [Chamaesiphon minutus PCC 6605]